MKPVVQLMNRGVKEGVFPGAVLLVSKGSKIRFFQSFGTSDVLSGKTMTKESIFDLASLTKPLVTSLAVFKLIEKKQLSMEQNISTIIKQISDKRKKEITIGQLLRHTSGLAAHKEYYKKVMGFAKTVRREKMRGFLIKEPLMGKPGGNQLYSDLGFILLAWIVETICGQRIDRFINKEVYKLLGIDNLFYIDNFKKQPVLSDDLYKKIVATENCPWREKTLLAEVHDDNAWSVGGIEGHAGLFGDAFSVWQISMEIMNALRGDKTEVLDSIRTLDLLKKEKESEFRAGFDTPSKHGASSGKYFSEHSIGHLGFTGTSFWIDPVKALIIVLLSNRVHFGRGNDKIKTFRPAIHNLIVEQNL